MRWAREHPWSVPFAALSVLSLIYLVLISRLGFYWDDWASVWTAESVGPAGLRELFADDRPLLGLLYEGFFSVVPSDPLLVQIMSIALRLLAALGVWAYVRTVWPKLEFEALTASLLFFVYPGFSQQAVALTYGLGAFFPLACLMWSIICSLQAARSPSRRALWVAAAIVLLLGSLVTEYFLVLEVLRLAGFLVLLGARRDDRHLSLNRANISVVSKAWLPYGLIYVPYLLWRMLALDPERADADARSLSRFIEEPVGSFKSLASSLVTDPVESSIGAWFQTTPPEAFERWIALFAGVAAFAVVALAARASLSAGAVSDDSRRPAESGDRSVLILAATGVAALGFVPAWLVGRQVELQSNADRYTLASSVGVALALGAGLPTVVRSSKARSVVVGLLVGTAACFQVVMMLDFSDDWSDQRRFAGELSWRAEGLEPGTSILLAHPDRPYWIDDSVSAAANLALWPEVDPMSGANTWAFQFEDVREEVPDGWGAGVRGIYFEGDPDRVLGVVLPDEGCLRLVDRARDYWVEGRALAPYVSVDPQDVIGESDAADRDLPAVLGGALPHSWCYYFQAADLATQRGDYDAALRLLEPIDQQGFGPTRPEEWAPFYEAALSVQSPAAGEIGAHMRETPVGADVAGRVERYVAASGGRPAEADRIAVP
jgi:hypothetical protein